MQHANHLPYQNLSTSDVKNKLDQGETFRLIDVREPREHAIAQIDGAELLPLSRASEWVSTLPHDEEIVFFCHHGGRSQQIAEYLATEHSFTNVATMVGGIDEWARVVDPSVARY